MPDRKTLLVVGAGASTEAKLPTSQDLKDSIAGYLNFQLEEFGKRLSGDDSIYEALKLTSVDQEPTNVEGRLNQYLDAALRIHTAMPQAQSIDNFIDDHRGNKEIELCGKLAIVRAILHWESKSLLRIHDGRPQPDFKALEHTWFDRFFRLLTENCTADALDERMKSVALIIFNYDRCVEHFLYYSLQNYYADIDENAAAKLVQSIEIYHPYGTVGQLPWQPSTNPVGFGRISSPQGLLNASKEIKTFTEGTDQEASEIIRIRELICESNIILFLGFAFHQMNLKLLTPSIRYHDKSITHQCFATAKGISKSDCLQIESELYNLGIVLGNIELRVGLECKQLFHEFSWHLSLIK